MVRPPSAAVPPPVVKTPAKAPAGKAPVVATAPAAGQVAPVAPATQAPAKP